ncbi:MAG: acetate/propionate family kinase [Povalibacter sp.]
MHILALNCGSSSIKSVLIDTGTQQRLLEMRIENLGSEDCRLLIGDEAQSLGQQASTAEAAIPRLLSEMKSRFPAGVRTQAVAHRIVHGGAEFTHPTVLDDNTLARMGELNDLAPLHNPFALQAVRIAREHMPEVPHVAIFDTAFHSTLPARARTYAVAKDVAEKFGIRRYGFHGTSHAQVTRALSRHLNVDRQSLRIISCHLGNGASVAAVEYGRSVETSMGMTPLEGLVMGTRSGDIDPGALLYLLSSGYDAGSLDELLNHHSGLAGLTGTNDLRQIEQRAEQGDEGCRLALSVYAHRVRKYIGAYAAVMGGVDAIVFTGGIGENSAQMRHRILQRFDFLGARLDEDRNRDARLDARTSILEIGEPHMRTRVFVVSANEELEIALQASASLQAPAKPGAMRIQVEVSARHAHLTQATLEALFGPGHQLQPRAELSQHGQYAAVETVTLIGPRGRLEKVRVMGPPRGEDQIEISRSDEFALGIDAPVRLSGDLRNSPGIVVEGPAGRATLASGVICARRHIHMSTQDAERLGLRDHDSVMVKVDSDGRDLVFADVALRVDPSFTLRLHLDTDEANAAGLKQGDEVELLLTPRT